MGMKKMVQHVIANPDRHYHCVILKNTELMPFLDELVTYGELYHDSLKVTYLQHNQEYMLTFDTRGL